MANIQNGEVQVTYDLMQKMCKVTPNKANVDSVLAGLMAYGSQAGLLKPQRLAHYLAQVMHESGSYKYDREIWGPTVQQLKYDPPSKVAKRLGNTKKGDGRLFMGRTGMQLTGRGNYKRFTKWAKSVIINALDFEAQPDKINTDPWEGLVPIWFWDVGNSEGKSLNKYADQNNIEMITLRINGGKNGLGDRMDNYVRAALVILGYSIGRTQQTLKAAVIKFQTDRKMKEVDGVAGNATRMELHNALGGSNPFKVVETVKVEKPVAVKVPEPVKVASLEKPWYMTKEGLSQAAAGPIGAPLMAKFQGLETKDVLLFFGIGLAIFAIYFGFRMLHKKHQDEQVAAIQTRADIKTQGIKDDRAEAEATLKAHQIEEA